MARTNRKYSRKISRRTSRKTNRKSRRRRKRKEIKRKKSLQKGGMMDELFESGMEWAGGKYAAGKKKGTKAVGLVSRVVKSASDEKLEDGDTKLEISGTFLKAGEGGGRMKKRRFTFFDDQNELKWVREGREGRSERLFNSFVVKEDPSSILSRLGGREDDDRFDREEFVPYLEKLRNSGKFNSDNDLLLFKKGAPWEGRKEGEPLHFRFESSKYRDIFYSVFDAQRGRVE